MGFIPEFEASEWNLIRDMVREYRQKRYNQILSSAGITQDRRTPDVFIALTPTGGIPSRDGFVPGKATCQVYRIVTISNVDTLQTVPDLTRVVYNTSIQAIDGGQFIGIKSDKWGRWLADGCNICYYDDTGTGTGQTGGTGGTGTGGGGPGSITVQCCEGVLIPATLYGVFDEVSSCACLVGQTITLTYQTVSSYCGIAPGSYTGWFGTVEGICGGRTMQIMMVPCTIDDCGGFGGFGIRGCCGTGDLNGTTYSNLANCVCDPLFLEFNPVETFGSNCGCTSFSLTVTETAP
jgi:hypothetical protein